MPKRDIALPPVHNTRSPEQWRIISEHVDFDGKTVLDLGCGYGDLLWRAWAAGAKECTGIDESEVVAKKNVSTVLESPLEQGVFILFGDCTIEYYQQWVDKNAIFDIVICFSVLPYLTDPTATLHWIREHSTIALIECQLAGDGPGFDWLKSSMDMRRWLDSIGWKSIKRIGETVVKDRGAKRGIWLCQQ